MLEGTTALLIGYFFIQYEKATMEDAVTRANQNLSSWPVAFPPITGSQLRHMMLYHPINTSVRKIFVTLGDFHLGSTASHIYTR